MLDALNRQVNEEMKSAYLYLAMAADFQDQNRPGFASWMKVQASEEMKHAMKIYGFIEERGGKVVLQAIDAPQDNWASPLKAFEAAYAHEQFITDCIHKLVKLAREIGDLPTEVFLHWFVDEQVEEEATADEVIQKIKQVQDSGNGLYMLDRELGKRED
ncbi:MAG: ferritin [Spirochaetales bacterium]|nr:ferritin [Spirochaetales bacterium]